MSVRQPHFARVGDRISRPEVRRFLTGRGQYVSDIKLPRMLHLAFLRSPHAHARILSIDIAAASKSPGVVAVFTGADLSKTCKPLQGVSANRPGHKASPQYPMAVDKVVWQGQPAVALIAESRALAEDAAELVKIEWQALPAVLDGADALEPDAPCIHGDLGDNLAYEHNIVAGDPEGAIAAADVTVSHDFRFHRQTGLTLEPRGLVADFNPGTEVLTVYHSHQSPFQMQEVFCKHLDIPESKVRVIAPDVGGGFGTKINTYAEELAVAAISHRMCRPIKFCADRLESFSSDAHARDHQVTAQLAVTADGKISAMTVDDIASLGAYGMHLRYNVAESMMLITNLGAPYRFENYRARARNAYVNKNLIGMFRGVGIPLSCVISEVLLDLTAERIGMDPVDLRRKNIRRAEELPCVTPGGSKLTHLSLDVCLERLVQMMDYDALRADQKRLRASGKYRGIGIANYVEPTAYGPLYYGPTGAAITSQDGCTLRLEPSGEIRCVTSITDQGQGTLTGLRQIISETVGVPVDSIHMISGDSTLSTYGGGAWASRGIICGGEATLKACRALVTNILSIAAAVSQTTPDHLAVEKGAVINRDSGAQVLTLAQVARIGYFRQDTLPPDIDAQLSVTRSHVVNGLAYYVTSGVQASLVEVDIETGMIKLLKHWAVADCGRRINPLLVDEQLRGGIVQGIGSVLYEECIYDEQGTLANGTMAEYLAPMAFEMPDMELASVETIEESTELGAKGVGESALIGAMGAVWVAVNDALKPLKAVMTHQPFTPERVLDAIALGRVQNNGRKL